MIGQMCRFCRNWGVLLGVLLRKSQWNVSEDYRCVRLEAVLRRMISVWHQSTANSRVATFICGPPNEKLVIFQMDVIY